MERMLSCSETLLWFIIALFDSLMAFYRVNLAFVYWLGFLEL